MTLRSVLVAAALASLAACAPRLLPGTSIKDSSETRPVYEVIRAYGDAMQKRDAAAVLALVAPDYLDSAGTPGPEDDLDRAALERTLATDFAKIDALKLDLGVKKIEVRGVEAFAEIFYDGYFRVMTAGGAVPKRESDLHRMQFRKIGADWKITSGL
jgi:ketosteroid isomerase-like protein